MYKIFAFAFFLSISITMASVFSKAEHSAVLGIDAMYIFLFDIAVYGTFLLYLIFGAIFKFKPRFSINPVDHPLLNKYANVFLDITYYLAALFVTAYMFLGFSKFFFNLLVTEEAFAKFPAAVVDAITEESEFANTINTAIGDNIKNSNKLDQLSYDIAKIERMLHAPAADKFFETNDKIITKQTANATVQFEFDRYLISENDLDNTYKYYFNFCLDSIDKNDPNRDRCFQAGDVLVWQNEIIQSLNVYEFSNSVFQSSPVFLVDLITDQKSLSYIFYPNYKAPSTYTQLGPYLFLLTEDTLVRMEDTPGKPNVLTLSLENVDKTHKLQFYILADGQISYAQFDENGNAIERLDIREE